ncbi:MAG: hypothetical protein ACE5KZ_08080 [Candidatus Scalinduaceae bacterium]
MRVFFIIFDYIVAILMGVGTLFLVSLVIGKDWNMFFTMILGMILGMVVLAVTVLVFSPICSLFQLFPSGMIITMLTGMAAGMIFTATGIDFMVILLMIIVFSFSVQFGIDLYNMKLKGELPVDGAN